MKVNQQDHFNERGPSKSSHLNNPTNTEETKSSSQIVYVLTNPAMPDLIKIGKANQDQVQEQMKQLYSTGISVPFECAFACQVKDAKIVEEALHVAFGNARINPNREFFKTKAERVMAILKLLQVKNLTMQIEETITSEISEADKNLAPK